jgi:hypothetical protein
MYINVLRIKPVTKSGPFSSSAPRHLLGSRSASWRENPLGSSPKNQKTGEFHGTLVRFYRNLMDICWNVYN